MKKTALLTAALVVLATIASAASIKNSKHDLSTASTSGGQKSTTTTEICVFCHTPHNPGQNVPLWNRTNPLNTGWTMYASPTLTASATTKLATGTFDADSISLFCLSCHDGATALGAMVNTPVTGADALPVIAAASAKIGLTKVLSNDHPVGFDYAAAQGQDTGLVLKATANTALGGSAFFGAGGNNIECASCHKVHDPVNAPFLRIANTGSALCLACHSK